MQMPQEAFTITGGCACKSIRYRVNVPEHNKRLALPYKSTGAAAAKIGDLRMPYSVICSCNDCRRHTANVFPTVLICDTTTVEISAEPKDPTSANTSKNDSDRHWLPANQVWNSSAVKHNNGDSSNSRVVGHYPSSPQRNRWFCANCGTPLGYSIDEDVMAQLGWPPMSDIWLGTVDRECLQHEWMQPQHRLWGYMGIPWVRTAMGKMGDMKESPLFKIDQTWDDDLTEDLAFLKKLGKV